MESIIKPVERDLLLQELTPERKLQDTNRGGNEIYVFDACHAPNLMREVARLREEAFRSAGGGSGKSMDIDIYDTMPNPYMQLIVWAPNSLEIIGGYRFKTGNNVSFNADGTPMLATAELFDYSKEFLEEYLPATIELGRSFVSPGYQNTKAAPKSIFALDNLWDGLATIMMLDPNLLYYFGKVTIHPRYSREAASFIMHYLSRYYKDCRSLIWPKIPIEPTSGGDIFCKGNAMEDYHTLKKAVSKLGFSIPPLINSYINLSSTMTYFGFAECHDFAGAIEGGILVNSHDIYPQRKERHTKAFLAGEVNGNVFAQSPI